MAIITRLLILLSLQSLLLDTAHADVEDSKCDSGFEYVYIHYDQCCGYGRYKRRPEVCAQAKPLPEQDERTTSYPKLPKTLSKVPPACSACARMIDSFDMALLPRLGERHKQLQKHHSKSRLAQTATVGELEAIVEDEVDRICTWPRTRTAPRA